MVEKKDSAAAALQQQLANGNRRVRPAVSARLKRLLWFVFALLAVLGANSVYLAAVTFLGWASGQLGEPKTYENYTYLVMFLLHLTLGLVLVVPFIAFGVFHMMATWKRRNRRAVMIGYVLFGVSIAVLATGVLLVRIPGSFDLKQPLLRSTLYWLHVIGPVVAVWLYCLHRLAGRRIRWRIGLTYAAMVTVIVLGAIVLHSQDPRSWNASAPPEGAKYFEPSLARTNNGKWIPARALDNDQYCKKCHEDVYDGWFHSAHHFSSFNNPAYLATIRETREVLLKRDGSVQASRWCAGCHDPVPFFSGAFDDPKYDMVSHPTARAGVTCTACHAITHVNSTRGNGDYVIEEPLQYPFTYSDNGLLQFINNTLVKAKPEFHKKTYLKPFHKTAEFCSVCHKVSLPKEVTHYKEFLRGQNHYDNFLLSGTAGVSLRSFYYPKVAEPNCHECHAPPVESDDFGARVFAGKSGLRVHDHTFLGANTAIAWWAKQDAAVQAHQDFLRDSMRVDLFGLRAGDAVEGKLVAPLRPGVPAVERGKTYLLETVVRNLTVAHLFSQGTTDSNEIWLEVTLTSGGRVIGKSGGMSPDGEVDRWAHYLNVFMLDRHGNRINRRNGQDIFVPLYNHQIPPGSAQTVHYQFAVPDEVTDPIEVEVKLWYRKFDKEYVDYIARQWQEGDPPLRDWRQGGNPVEGLPVSLIAEDRVVLPVKGIAEQVENVPHQVPLWQRWNDYGIGLLLKGKVELRQATEAFEAVERLGRYDGPVNLGRTYLAEGRINDAVDAVKRAAGVRNPAAPQWTLLWLSGMVNREQGRLDEAIKDLRGALAFRTEETAKRGFDFSKDYMVRNELGKTLFARAQRERGAKRKARRDEFLRAAVEEFRKTLKLDAENITAHYNLQLILRLLGETEQAEFHGREHRKYQLDDNARDAAVQAARRKYPWADHAAEPVVIYSLQRPGSPGLADAAVPAGEPSISSAAVSSTSRAIAEGKERKR